MSLDQMQLIVEDLERRIDRLEDRPIADSIAVPNIYEINNSGGAEKPKEGGTGLETFTDNFSSEESYSNYEFVGGGGLTLSQVGGISEKGLVLTDVSSLGKNGHDLLMLFKPFRDKSGKGRCVDSIQILELTLGTTNTRRIGLATRCRYALAEETGGALFYGYTPRVTGLAGAESKTLEDTRWFPIAGVQKQESIITKPIEPTIPAATKFWLMVRTEANQIHSTIWLSNPLTAAAGTTPRTQLDTIQGDEQANATVVGMIVGTPGDLAIYLGGYSTGDTINSYTAIPLSWR